MGWFRLLTRLLRSVGGLLVKLFQSLKASRWSTWIIFAFLELLGSIIGRIFLLLGVSMTVNKFLTPSIMPYISTQLLGLPPKWINFIAMTQADKAITVVMSAMAIAVAGKISLRRRGNSWS